MKNIKLFYGVSVVVVLFAIGVGIFTYLNRLITISDNIYTCNEDADCVSVKDECCGCSAGGSSTAINKNYSDYWNNKISNECKGTLCPAVMSDHWTCFAKPKCVNNRCQLLK